VKPGGGERVSPAVAGWVIGAAAAITAALIIVYAGLPSLGPRPFELSPALLAPALFGAAVFELWIEGRRDIHAFDIVEIPILIGIVFTPARQLLFSRAIASAAFHFGARRKPPYRAFFNVAISVLDTLIAVDVYYAVLGAAQPTSRLGWLAAAVAILASQAIDWLAMVLLFAMTLGAEGAAKFVRSVPVAALISFTNTCLALIAVLVLWSDALAGVLLVGVCVVLGTGYQAHQRLRRRAGILSRIHDFTQALDGQSGMEGLRQATLDAARVILGARSSELWLKQGMTWLHYVATDDDFRVATSERPARLEESALAEGHGALVKRPRKRSEHRSTMLADRGAKDAISVPLQNRELEGVLTVTDRVNQNVTFTVDDMRALESMAAHAGVALHTAILLERVAQDAEEKEYQALHDALTGLPNRTMFSNVVEATMARGASGGREIAVMLLDLDSFKEVNDTLGHGVGDAVLKVLAARLSAEVGERGTVARLGGDEYAVIVPVDDRDHAIREAERVKACIEEPIDEEGLLIEPRTSVGVAMSPDNGDDAATLLRLADVAMYSAKENRAGVTVYEPKYDHYSPRRLTLAGELRQAIAASELLVTYQPQQDLASGAITAVEALVRWNHRVHGFVPPDEFIPVAEQTGLIVPLTDYVLTETLSQQVRWQRQGLDLEVSVNLSPRVVQDSQLPALVAQRLEATGCEPRRLTLELTETGLINDHARVAAILHQLAGMGVRVSIDDFGTGYSSLSRLSDLPVNEVKIDKSFVFAMANGAPETVVRSIIDLGHNLGLRVVAEGVEDLGTLQRLRQLRCHAVQGYVLSRAVAANVLEAWLADQEIGAPAGRVIVPLRKPVSPRG
jgi:diguanylate cyclase (GGDEF)-like protein